MRDPNTYKFLLQHKTTMESFDPNSQQVLNITARDEARQIAQGFGSVFENLQEMVDDIERKLLSNEEAVQGK